MRCAIQSAGYGCYTALKQFQGHIDEVRHGTNPGYQEKKSNMGSQEVLVQSLCLVAVIQNKATIIGDHNIRA